jgi:hypothetical protein
MANSLVNQSEQARLAFGCANINKCKRLGLLTDALVAAATSFQDLLDDIAAIANAVTFNPSQYHHYEALVRELKWLNGKDILTDSVVTSLTTVNTASATTDLRYNFSVLLDDQAGFEAAREDYTESASGATAY